MELGKTGKHQGQKHPRDLRKTDPVPVRPTPKAKPKRKVHKRFGFKYQHLIPMFEGRELLWRWNFHWHWYATPEQRDQAMSTWHYHRTYPSDYRAPVAVERP